jgi:hypothetical protein
MFDIGADHSHAGSPIWPSRADRSRSPARDDEASHSHAAAAPLAAAARTAPAARSKLTPSAAAAFAFDCAMPASDASSLPPRGAPLSGAPLAVLALINSMCDTHEWAFHRGVVLCWACGGWSAAMTGSTCRSLLLRQPCQLIRDKGRSVLARVRKGLTPCTKMLRWPDDNTSMEVQAAIAGHKRDRVVRGLAAMLDPSDRSQDDVTGALFAAAVAQQDIVAEPIFATHAEARRFRAARIRDGAA